MRDYLETLRARGDLLEIDREVDPRHEVAAVARRLQQVSNKAVRFNRVKGSRMPVVLNVFSDHDRLREIIRCGEMNFCERLHQQIDQAGRMAPAVATGASSDPGDWESGRLSDLPILTYHGRDGAPYITSGIFLARDPDTGVPNLSFHRGMVVSDDELRIRLGSTHDLARLQQAAEARNSPSRQPS